MEQYQQARAERAAQALQPKRSAFQPMSPAERDRLKQETDKTRTMYDELRQETMKLQHTFTTMPKTDPAYAQTRQQLQTLELQQIAYYQHLLRLINQHQQQQSYAAAEARMQQEHHARAAAGSSDQQNALAQMRRIMQQNTQAMSPLFSQQSAHASSLTSALPQAHFQPQFTLPAFSRPAAAGAFSFPYRTSPAAQPASLWVPATSAPKPSAPTIAPSAPADGPS